MSGSRRTASPPLTVVLTADGAPIDLDAWAERYVRAILNHREGRPAQERTAAAPTIPRSNPPPEAA